MRCAGRRARAPPARAAPPRIPPPPPVGDAPTAILRWRPLHLDAGTPAACAVAAIDRLFVLPFYRRRRIARMLVLNALVDVLDQSSKMGGAGLSRVSVFLPEDARLVPVFHVLSKLGFRQGARLAADPSGVWGAAAEGRSFLEVALPMAEVVAVLHAAHEAGESVRARAA